MKAKSAETEQSNLSSGYQSNLNGFTPNAAVSVVRFLLTPLRDATCDGDMLRWGIQTKPSREAIPLFQLIGMHPEVLAHKIMMPTRRTPGRFWQDGWR